MPPARHPELEAKLIDDPNDVETRLVYADFLRSRRDPRGELIILQHHGKEAEANALLEAHKDEFFGPLRGYRTVFDNTKAQCFTWHLGFIRKARLSYDVNYREGGKVWRIELGNVLADLLEHPSGKLLEELVLPMNRFAGIISGSALAAGARVADSEEYGSLVKALSDHGAPALRSLRIGNFQFAGIGGNDTPYADDPDASFGDATKLWKALPRLERLVFHAGYGSMGPIEHPRLRHFELITASAGMDVIRAMSAANLPSLETLNVWIGYSEIFSVRLDHLLPLLEGKGLPNLEHLGILNADFNDGLCEALGKASLATRLESLSLSCGRLTDAAAQSLARHKDNFPRLKRLDVTHTRVTSEGLEALKTMCPEVVS